MLSVLSSLLPQIGIGSTVVCGYNLDCSALIKGKRYRSNFALRLISVIFKSHCFVGLLHRSMSTCDNRENGLHVTVMDAQTGFRSTRFDTNPQIHVR